LVRRGLKAGCPKGGLVLDPFVGSGTTLFVAQELGMKGIGIELNEKYIPLMKKRLLGHENQTSLNPDKVEVLKLNE
jgi:site-specific DNA-methyltransferase (adenine-specific)